MPREKTSVSREDYLKAIWEMVQEEQEPISARLAEELGATPPSHSAAVCRLTRDGLLRVERSGRIALTRKGSAAAPLDAKQAVARETLQCRGYGRRGDAQLFRQARADGLLLFLDHLPDGLQVVFARHTGFFARHESPCPEALRRLADVHFITEALRQAFHARFNLVANPTVNGEVESIRVAHIPIRERKCCRPDDRLAAPACHVDHEIRRGEILWTQRL